MGIPGHRAAGVEQNSNELIEAGRGRWVAFGPLLRWDVRVMNWGALLISVTA